MQGNEPIRKRRRRTYPDYIDETVEKDFSLLELYKYNNIEEVNLIPRVMKFHTHEELNHLVIPIAYNSCTFCFAFPASANMFNYLLWSSTDETRQRKR